MSPLVYPLIKQQLPLHLDAVRNVVNTSHGRVASSHMAAEQAKSMIEKSRICVRESKSRQAAPG